jgi:outer membrane protein assembly factor BamE
MTACSGGRLFQFPGVYKISITQGNIITQDMIDQLRPGMTKRQVVFVMGTPMVADPFHQDRWDYVYNFQPGGGDRVGERVTVMFDNDQLVQITGDYQPNTQVSN